MLIDPDLPFLEDTAELVDGHLSRLDSAVSRSDDPDGTGLLEQMENLTGLGFVACQAYITATKGRSGRRKADLLQLGPSHRSGQTFVAIVNAAANLWKHVGEWDRKSPSSKAEETMAVIRSLGVDPTADYPLGNVLYELLTPHAPRFAHLIPFLTHWRDIAA